MDFESEKIGLLDKEGKWILEPQFNEYFRPLNRYFYTDQIDDHENTYQKTKSPDLSAYISDDIDLIGFHLLNGTENKWVSALFATYLEYQIPHSILPQADKSLLELIK